VVVVISPVVRIRKLSVPMLQVRSRFPLDTILIIPKKWDYTLVLGVSLVLSPRYSRMTLIKPPFVTVLKDTQDRRFRARRNAGERRTLGAIVLIETIFVECRNEYDALSKPCGGEQPEYSLGNPQLSILRQAWVGHFGFKGRH